MCVKRGWCAHDQQYKLLLRYALLQSLTHYNFFSYNVYTSNPQYIFSLVHRHSHCNHKLVKSIVQQTRKKCSQSDLQFAISDFPFWISDHFVGIYLYWIKVRYTDSGTGTGTVFFRYGYGFGYGLIWNLKYGVRMVFFSLQVRKIDG